MGEMKGYRREREQGDALSVEKDDPRRTRDWEKQSQALLVLTRVNPLGRRSFDSRLGENPRLRRFQLRIEVRERSMPRVGTSSLDPLLLLASGIDLRRVVELGRRSDRFIDEVQWGDFLHEREKFEGVRRRRSMVFVRRRRKREREGIWPGGELLEA